MIDIPENIIKATKLTLEGYCNVEENHIKYLSDQRVLDAIDRAVEKIKNPDVIDKQSCIKPLKKNYEVAEMLGFTRVHISRLADAGELTRVNIGTDIKKPVFRISVESINAFIKRRSVQTKNVSGKRRSK